MLALVKAAAGDGVTALELRPPRIGHAHQRSFGADARTSD
jgi:hypothetical protein